MYSLFTPSAFEAPDFQARHEESKSFLVQAIASEDGPMVVALQNSVASPFYKPGPFSFLEDGVHHIMKHYLDNLSPLEEAPR